MSGSLITDNISQDTAGKTENKCTTFLHHADKTRLHGQPHNRLRINYAMKANSNDPHLVAAMQAMERDIISSRSAAFVKILNYNAKTLSPQDRADFESEAWFRFFRSVRLNLFKWQCGKNDFILTAIAKGAYNHLFKKKHRRAQIVNGYAERFMV